MNEEEEKYDLKIILLGSSKVGKTTLVNRLTQGTFENPEQTTGATFSKKKYQGELQEYTFSIWDTAGEERFDSLSSFYCRNSGCELILYDITDRNSFTNLDRFFDKLQYTNEDSFVILIGTKLDLIEETSKLRKVTLEEGKKKANDKNSYFFEISSKTGHNIQELWETVGDLFEKNSQKNEIKHRQDNNHFQINSFTNNQKKKNCC
ncbi:ras-related protein rab-24 [Anaeramoeba ignava]|uniref:Ras-related protein rab-24 n=1 Tax=Anaeramoeba ignava TaxID=1746090 RepID=A0A9Q0RD32_ANAIG|nr:ras-related protein rab-24 [Anaeramoeba ignava]